MTNREREGKIRMMGAMATIEEVESLRCRLAAVHEKFEVLTHPEVVRASQQLDEAIVEYYRRRGKERGENVVVGNARLAGERSDRRMTTIDRLLEECRHFFQRNPHSFVTIEELALILGTVVSAVEPVTMQLTEVGEVKRLQGIGAALYTGRSMEAGRNLL